MSVTVGNRAAPTVTSTSTSVSTTKSGLEGLCRGSSGPAVKALQEQLNARGGTLELDGKFGPLTEAALKKFQADAGCTGAGRVDAATVAALKAPVTTPATTPAATDNVAATCSANADRAKTLGTASPPSKPSAPALPAAPTTTTTTTPAAETSTKSVKLDAAQVKTALAAIDTGKKQAAEEKAVLGQVKEALQREVKTLETPIKGKASTVADQAVLAGRKGQLDAIQQAERLCDIKLKGYDAATTAVSDGVVTQTEANALNEVDGAFKKGEAALKTVLSSSSSLVDKGLAAGGRGKPALGLRKPETPATPATPTPTTATTEQKLSASDVELGRARIKTAVAGANENLLVLDKAKRDVQTEVKSLEALKDPTVADKAVLAGRQAQLQVIDGATKQMNARIAGLKACDTAIADGVLTADEAKNLGAAQTALNAAEQHIASQANLATEVIRLGRAAGGRGTDAML